MVSPVLLRKEHPDLPDSYGIEVNPNIKEFKAASQRLIDKVYEDILDDNGKIVRYSNGKIKQRCVGISSIPILEVWNDNNELLWIPLTSAIKFDKDFSKILEIAKKR